MGSGAASHVVERWGEFWFGRGRADALAVFRILFAVCLLLEARISLSANRLAIEGGFHLPYLSWIPLLPKELYSLLHAAQYPCIVLLGLGCFTRTACLALLGLQGYVFFADQLNFRNHPYLFLLILLLLLQSPCSEHYSLRAASRGLGSGRRAASQMWPLTAQRLIQFQISAVYLFAAGHKINPQFLGGHVLAHYFGQDLATGSSLLLLDAVADPQTIRTWVEWVKTPANMVMASWVTLLAEIFLAFGLWFRRTRPWAMLIGFALHLGIAVVMDVWSFTVAVLGSYLLFLDGLPWSKGVKS